MFFVKGRSKCDADPWRLGRGQRRRVLPTRKRVSTFSFLFNILSYQFHPQVLLDEPPWEVCARLQCDDHPIPIHRVCWTDRVSIKQTTSTPLHPQTQNMRISIRATSAETEEQQPNWGDVHDWGELYDLEADPQVLRTLWKEWDSCQENFNLYRDHDYLDLKVQMRKLLHAGWYDHN